MICLDFPSVLPWRVMARLFKTVVNTPLLLPIYFVPVDFYRMMCGLIVSRRPPINSTVLLAPPPQGSAAQLCPSAWSEESSHARDTPLISVAPGVMSS